MDENTILNLGDVKLVRKDGRYYIYRISDSCMFDIQNNWKSNQKNRYMTLSTRDQIIRSIKNLHSNKPGVSDFIEWYDKFYDINNIPQSNPSIEGINITKVDMTETNNLLKGLMNEIQTQNQFVNTNIIEVLADKMLSVKASEVAEKITKSVDNYIATTYGSLPQKYEFILPETTVTDTGIFHHLLPDVMKYIIADIPLMLVGPAGSGKNYTLEKAAKELSLDFYFTNAITQEYKLTGFIDAHGVYQETQFYKAFKNGGVFFLDEIDASIPEALIILNAAIANKYFDFPNGRIEAHKDFRVVAAANTYGTGADIVYVGRNVLDGATLDRFVVLEFDYDSRVEKDRCPDKELYEFCLRLREAIANRNLRYIISIRVMINAYKMLQCKFDKKTIIKTAITKSMTKDDINNVINDLPSGEWRTALAEVYGIL